MNATEDDIKPFSVALSFPGQHRQFVRNVATRLAEQLGQERVFFDEWHTAKIRGSDADLKLKRIYREGSMLIVPFFSRHYEKMWCQIEWHTIRGVLAERRKDDAVVPVHLDQTVIDGWDSIDLGIRKGRKTGRQVAEEIIAAFLHRFPEPMPAVTNRSEGTPMARTAPKGLRLFFNHLIQSHTHLFAGRDAEIRQILTFIRDQGSGYVLVEGLSGYGKTSLLAELVRCHPNFSYHFISQGYKSSGSEFDPTHLEALLANLCEQLGAASTRSDVHELRVHFQQLIAMSFHSPTVLVIDAIDEVDRHPNYLLGLLPRRLPLGLFIVLSARSQGERCYLSEVGLDRADIGLSIHLSGLSEATVTLLLHRAGGKALAAARQGGFVSQLHTVSAGDPFYLRFLVEDVARGVLTLDNIQRTPTGLPAYLDQQLSLLNRSAYRPQHRDILGLVLAAHQALSRTDLLRIVPGLDGLNFDDVLRDIHRFLLVHNDQYTFCHVRFKEYFAAKIDRACP